jgi:CubicO group peptidase (beta-lactamase class C family)
LTDDGLESLAGWPGAHRAAGWRRSDGTSAVAGEADRSFDLASVTKLLTATAVLVAVQEEVVALDQPAGPPGSTVRLLLCHASGLPFEGTEPIAPPGQRRIYSNTAYEVLGDLVVDRAGIAFGDYVRDGVIEPLAMGATMVGGSPAHGGRSTIHDLLRLAGELLHPGRVLDPAVLAEATTAQLPELAGILPGYGRQDPNPWGLGFEIRGHKAPHWTPPEAGPTTFGHFGQSGALLWVDPTVGVACAALGDEPFGPWALEAWPILGSGVLEATR